MHNPVTRDQFITVQLVIRLKQIHLKGPKENETKGNWFAMGLKKTKEAEIGLN